MHNQPLKYRMGTTDYKAVLQESSWGCTESEALRESTVSCRCRKGGCQTGTCKQQCHVLDMWSNPTRCRGGGKRSPAARFWHCTSKHMLSSHGAVKWGPGPGNMTCEGWLKKWGWFGEWRLRICKEVKNCCKEEGQKLFSIWFERAPKRNSSPTVG